MTAICFCDNCGDEFKFTDLRRWKYDPDTLVCENCYEQMMNDDEVSQEEYDYNEQEWR